MIRFLSAFYTYLHFYMNPQEPHKSLMGVIQSLPELPVSIAAISTPWLALTIEQELCRRLNRGKWTVSAWIVLADLACYSRTGTTGEDDRADA